MGGYDGMAAIAHVVQALKGKIEPDKVMEALKGWVWEKSPRGPIMIDPETRDIIQNIYIRKVERVGGELYNTEFATFNAVKDPGKEKN